MPSYLDNNNKHSLSLTALVTGIHSIYNNQCIRIVFTFYLMSVIFKENEVCGNSNNVVFLPLS